ncbi:MAG: (S)-benzoin forming benzil reductase [Bacteroidales bacterium]|nr:(S)-benzoin forming benzil reductase [Bacteroidales bacterium]
MKYFIITGASKGLGEGLALELLHENHHLFCISRTESKRLSSLAAAKNCRLDFFAYDLSVHYDIPALINEIFKSINQEIASGIYLINNAGVIQPVGRVEDCDPEDVEWHVRINLLAPMLLSSAFIRKTRDINTVKRILNISSGAAQNPYYGWSCYCTSKAGLDMFGRCISEEQKEEKFPVETMGVAPGIIDTEMQTTIRSTTDRAFKHRKKFIEYKENGLLIQPGLAGKRLAGLLLSDAFEDGRIIDIRDTY